MSEKTKRHNKTPEELQMELEKQNSLKFWEDIRKVEDKHKLRVRAYLHSTLQGIAPILSAEPIVEVDASDLVEKKGKPQKTTKK
jgi:hypothetical protein